MPKRKYRTCNWSHYNKSNKNRGRINIYFTASVAHNWYSDQRTAGRGRPQYYSDSTIYCALTLKAVYGLTYRATQGFLESLIEMLKLPFSCPNYTLLCKRQEKLKVKLPRKRLNNEGMHIVIDSTGVKVYGDGEWKSRHYGRMRKRLWRKLHVGINADTQMIEASGLSQLGIQDCEGLPFLLDQIPGKIDTVIADRAYDAFSCYEAAQEREAKGIFPPQYNALTSEESPRSKSKASTDAVAQRDHTILQVRKKGKKKWKRDVGYHRRSLVETTMFRLKTIFGNQLKCRKLRNQQVEAQIRCAVLNKMTMLGMPCTIAT